MLWSMLTYLQVACPHDMCQRFNWPRGQLRIILVEGRDRGMLTKDQANLLHSKLTKGQGNMLWSMLT